MKKKVASLAVFALMSAAPAFAQSQVPDPAALAAARALFDSQYRDSVVQMMRRFADQAIRDTRANGEAFINRSTNLSDEQKKAGQARVESDVALVTKVLNAAISDSSLLDDIINDTAKAYARVFTADELKQLAAFYHTPVGAKVLTAMPQLMAEAAEANTKTIQRRVQPLLQQARQQQAQQLQQSSPAPKAPPQPPGAK